MNPSYNVPPEYFYALTATLPFEITAEERYRQATMQTEEQTLALLQKSITAGVIDEGLSAINSVQAARRMAALGAANDQAIVCRILPGTALHTLIQGWLVFTSTPIDPFWTGLDATERQGHLDLVLCAITYDHTPLITAIKNHPTSTVSELASYDITTWRAIFDDGAGNIDTVLLPRFTEPGTPEERFNAFIRYVRRYFTVGGTTTTVDPATVDRPPIFGPPGSDPIGGFVSAYGAQTGVFDFGQGRDSIDFEDALAVVFPDDTDARDWLRSTIQMLDALYLQTNGLPAELRFSIMEALYARGFRSDADVTALDVNDFQDALIGTVAHLHAATIHGNAGGGTPATGPGAGSFQPINSSGRLMDCHAPAHLSPFGMAAYLAEMLRVSEASTCPDPLPASATPSLRERTDSRRGDLGTLAATRANLETRLPVVDLVNECLEAMTATGTPQGVVHDTATDTLHGHQLATHGAETLLAVVPEFSSPATPVAAQGAYDVLAADFSAPELPYSQPVDVNRAYLGQLGSTRYQAMRAFWRNIREFVLDATQEPADFERHLWRYPVRVDIAREYLSITREEHEQLYTANPPAPGPIPVRELYGYTAAQAGTWLTEVARVSEFLARTGLDYCEFLALWRSGFVEFARAGANPLFEDCEPCHLDEHTILFQNPGDPNDALKRLAVFIRLWRSLQTVANASYSFDELRDICEVLELFDATGAVNDDFLRQMAALQMLRDDLALELADADDDTVGTGAERSHLLALWVGPGARKWSWALDRLLDQVAHLARERYACETRPPEFIRLLSRHLAPISQLVGFTPTDARDTWNARVSHTLRFAEVLAKIYASDFDVGEILFLFRDDENVRDDDPLHWQTEREALDAPLGLPDDDDMHSLLALRRALRAIEVSDEEIASWTFTRMDAVLREEFGYDIASGAPDPWLSLGEHFFPGVLASEGWSVTAGASQYRASLAGTNAAMWNTALDGPFGYDIGAQELWTELPLGDEAVLAKLARVRSLSANEQQAVRDLYFAPRADLAHFAFLFENFAAAATQLVEEPDETARWTSFQRSFARFYARSRAIADHLAEHVAAVTGRVGPSQAHENGDPGQESQEDEDRQRLSALAWRLIRHLYADENKGLTPWEAEDGAPPDVLWGDQPNARAFAALLGVVGTGLVGEYQLEDDPSVVWREVRGPMDAFGAAQNAANAPVATVVPAMDFALAQERARWLSARNGFGVANRDGTPLGGAQAFTVNWRGVLFLEHAGTHEISVGAPTPEGEAPDFDAAQDSRWRVTLTRGNKSWLVSSHDWPSEQGISRSSARIPLERGAYQLLVEFTQPEAALDGDEDVCPGHTGLQVKYQGPDTDDRLLALPFDRLFIEKKDTRLDDQLPAQLTGTARSYLQTFYPSTLRDMRRTYVRAFKSLLFAHRLDLSAEPTADSGQSELGYMLEHGQEFAGAGTYRRPVGFRVHRAYFDPNLLPLHDNYMEPDLSHDIRARSTVQREAALFDWFERLFDYTVLRREARATREAPVWFLFHEAAESHPDDRAHLVRHLGVDLRHADLVRSYFEAQGSVLYQMSSADLEDERWATRVWRAENWLREMHAHFLWQEIRDARPALWASDKPQSVVSGQTTTGNENLTHFVRHGMLENGEPQRYQGLAHMNDGLRERARRALLAHLCGMDRVALPWGGFARAPAHLSELLLLDVEAGMGQRTSRIEDAVSAAQTYVQRHRLALESGWNTSVDFGRMWDRRFASFRTWEAKARRAFYRENWIEWDELEAARHSESFRELESELRRMGSNHARPGGMVHWDGPRSQPRPGIQLVQERDAMTMAKLPAGREGFDILATPERHARPSLLSSIPGATSDEPLPGFIQAAMRLGTRFIRLAAAGQPPASTGFEMDDLAATDCCAECGQVHDPLVDEYYFWLEPARYFKDLNGPANPSDPTDVYAPQDADVLTGPGGNSGWHDPQTLPDLLHWNSQPMVHLMWCRVHNGEFQQPMRSFEGVRVSDVNAQLSFMGRTGDSLRFQVSDAVRPTGYDDPTPAGFRFDMAVDAAEALPLVVAAPASTAQLSNLGAYPYFAYFRPGASLAARLYAPSLTMAGALRAHGRYQDALAWYERAFRPLLSDVRWCVDGDPDRPCDGVVSEEYARRRAVTLHYLETLLEWGESLARRGSLEALQQARSIHATAERILGVRPESAQAVNGVPVTIGAFAAQPAPLNPRLVALYDRVSDGLAKVRANLDTRRLQSGHAPNALAYADDERLRDGWQSTDDICLDEDHGMPMPSPYRYQFLMQKAQELAGEVRGLGGALLSAFEKGDAEYLASIRARHERQILELTLSIRKDQWRESDWQVQALQKTKEIAQTRRRYYQWLIDRGIISLEEQYRVLTYASMFLRHGSTAVEYIARAMAMIPDQYIGPAPTQRIPVGTKLAEMFSTIARVMNIFADISSTTAGLRLTEAGWQRREEEWRHQVEVLDIEIEQIERQILAAERRRDIALRELNNHQRQIENSAEVQAFLRDKFTNHQLYLWLQRETAALHYQMYELALHTARQAERAFNLENGFTAQRFVPNDAWDDLHEGLQAGERLQLALRQMEKSYLDQNVREYELTKHFSLRMHKPWALLQLRYTGQCEVEIPEWMFDLDYPGHYMRRIKNVTMTIPAVVGPYTGVHCRLTLLGSMTRVDPRLDDPSAGCCDGQNPGRSNGYQARPDDARVVKQYAAAEAIATSTGQNDSGMFELNFRDERYLPFEYAGAVSRWRIELPPENNYFDLETLNDLVLHINYMAREGGDVLRAAASDAAQSSLPDGGWRLLDIRHEMPSAWQRLLAAPMDGRTRPELRIRLGRDMFAFLPGNRELSVQRLEFLFEAPGADPSAHHAIEFQPSAEFAQLAGDTGMCEVQSIECVASAEWPGMYHGVIEIPACVLGVGDERELGTLLLPPDVGTLEHGFLVCGYSVE